MYIFSVFPNFLHFIFSFDLLEFIIKFGYNTRYHWLVGCVLSEYKTQSSAKTVTPSANLYNVLPFSGCHFSFFVLLIEREISEQASEPVATEELNKGL